MNPSLPEIHGDKNAPRRRFVAQGKVAQFVEKEIMWGSNLEHRASSDIKAFTRDFLNNTDLLLRPMDYWDKIINFTETSNNLLTSIPRCGQLYLQNSNSSDFEFTGQTFYTLFQHNQAFLCFTFESELLN